MSTTPATVSNGKRLSTKKDEAIGLLLSGRSVNEVAAELDLHPTSISRWRGDPEFMQTFKRRRQELWVRARADIETSQRRAVSTLTDLLQHQDARIRLRSAEVLLRAGGHITSDIGVEIRERQTIDLQEIKREIAECEVVHGQAVKLLSVAKAEQESAQDAKFTTSQKGS